MAASEEVASGYVSLYARMESSQVSSEVSKALSNALSSGGVSEALSSFGSSMAKIGAGLTAGLVAAIHESKELVGDLLDTISTTEQADIALTTMFTPEKGSREAAAEFADEYIGRLNEFAIETPFGFESALKGARTLIAMGFEGEEVLNDMRNGVLRWSGDMAAALGGDATTFNNIILQLGHMKSLGHVMSYQMNALARNGVPAWKALAEYINEANIEIEDFEGYTGNWDVEKVREATREGAISSEVGIDALEWYSKTNYLNLMEQQSHTFTGIMMNMEDAIQTPIRTLYETDAYQRFTSAMYDMLDPLRELTTALLPTFELAFEKVTPVIEFATEKIEGFTEALNSGEITPGQILAVVEALGGILAMGPALLGTGGIAKFFSGVAGVAEGINSKVVSVFGSIGDSVLAGTKKMGSGFSTAKTKAQSFSKFLEGIGEKLAVKKTTSDALLDVEWIQDQLDSGLISESEAMARYFQISEDYYTRTGQELAIFDKVHNKSAKRLEKQNKTLFKSLSSIGGKFKSVGGIAASVAKAIGGGFVSINKAVLSAIGTVVSYGLKAFSSFSKVALAGSSLVGVLSLVGTAGAGAFVAMGGNLRDLGVEIAATMSQVGGVVKQAMQGLTDAFNKILEEGQIGQFFEMLMNGIDAFVRQVSSAVPQFVEAFGQVFDQVVDGILDMVVKYGPDILGGGIQLFSGIMDGLTTIIDKITESLPELVTGITTALVENFPSLVEAGVGLFTGLVEAFATVVPLVIEQLPTLVKTLSETITTNAPALFEAAKTLFWTIADAVPVLIPIAIDALAGLVTDLANSINTSEDGEFGSKAAALLGQIGYAIGQAAPVALEALGGLLLSLVNKLPTFVNDFFTGGARFIFNLVTGFTGGEPVALKDVGSVVKSLVEKIGERLDRWSKGGAEWIENVRSGIKQKERELNEKVSKVVQDAIGNIKDKAGRAKAYAKEWITNAIAGFNEKKDELITNIRAAIHNAILELKKKAEEFRVWARESMANAIDGFNEKREELKTNIESAIGSPIKEWKARAVEFKENTRAWIDNAVSGVREKSGELSTQVKTVVDDAVAEAKKHDGDLIGAGGAFVGKLIEGVSGKAQEGLKETGSGIVSNLVNGIKEKAVDAITGASTTGQQIADAFGGGVESNGDGVVNSIGGVLKRATEAENYVRESEALRQTGENAMGKLSDGILAGAVDAITSASTTGQGVADALSDGILAGATDAITGASTTGQGVADAITESLEDNSDRVTNAAGGVAKQAMAAEDFVRMPSEFERRGEASVTGLSRGIGGGVGMAKMAMQNVKNGITGKLGDAATLLVARGISVASGLATGIGSRVSEVKTSMQTLRDGILGKLNDHKTMLGTRGNSITTSLATGIGANVAEVKSSVQKLRDGIWDKTSDYKTMLNTRGSSITTSLSNGLKKGTAVKSVKDSVQTLRGSINDKLNDSSTMLNGKGSAVTKSFANGIGDWYAKQKVAEAASGISQTAKDNIDTNSSWLGSNFAQGIADGLRSKIEQVRNAAYALNNAISGNLSAWLQINSPSKVAIGIGESFDEGLAMGLLRDTDYVADSAISMASSAVDAVNDEFRPGRISPLGVSADLNVSHGANGTMIDQMAEAFASKLSGVGVYLSANETAAQLAPSMDRALGRLSYMGV